MRSSGFAKERELERGAQGSRSKGVGLTAKRGSRGSNDLGSCKRYALDGNACLANVSHALSPQRGGRTSGVSSHFTIWPSSSFDAVTFVPLGVRRSEEIKSCGATHATEPYYMHGASSRWGRSFRELSCGSSLPFLWVAFLFLRARRTLRLRYRKRLPVHLGSTRVASTVFRSKTTPSPLCFAGDSARADTTPVVSTAWRSGRMPLQRFRKMAPVQAAITRRGRTASSRSVSNQTCRYRRSGSQARSYTDSL